jgi:glutamyl-tRNA synthetase
MIAGVEPFERVALEAATNVWMEKESIAFKDYAQAVRVALTGRSATPGLFEVLEVLGRDRSLARLDDAIGKLAG